MRRLLGVLLLLCGSAEAQDFIRYYPPNGIAQFTSNGTVITSTLPIGIPGSTKTVPGLYFTSDTDTGIYASSASYIMFSVNDAQRAYIGESYIGVSLPFIPITDGGVDIGSAAAVARWRTGYFLTSFQGSRSKTLTDNTATAFVRLSVADDDYEHCQVIYTAYAEDTATDARQIRAGTVHAAILNNSGTETVAFSTGDSSVVVTAGTFTCTFDGNSGAADTIDLRATCDTSLAATTTLTFEYRLDCPSTVTVTPQ